MWALRLSSAAHHKKRVWSWSGYIASSVSLILYLVYSKLEMRASDIEQKALSTIEMKDRFLDPQQQVPQQFHSSEALSNYFGSQYKNFVFSGDLNNTRRSENQAAVVFHLIQRVGSKMLTQFITALSKKRHFKIHTEPLFSEEAEETLGQDFEEATIKQIAAYKMATVHAQELPVLDYHKYKTKQPIMASIIRDPVERLISWFYFARSPWNFVGRYKNDPKVGLPTIDWVVQDYENCVIAGEPECSYIPGSSLPRTAFWRQSIYFCNWGDEDCTPFNGEHALQEAKRNVDAKFAVVGILEDMDTSVQVLEAYIPRFFKGGAALWEDKKDVFRKINQNWHKRKVSQPIRDLVIRNLTNEIEFYEFCKQRLYRQKALLYDRETL